MKKVLLGIIISLFMLTSISYAADIPPKPTKRVFVTDESNVLSDASENYIQENSLYLSKSSKAQIVVVTVDSLDGESIEDYATKLYTSWGIGSKELDNGILILLAKNDKKYRIESGYGLESIITDNVADEIKKEMQPYFKAADFEGGLKYGYDRLSEEVYKEYNLTFPYYSIDSTYNSTNGYTNSEQNDYFNVNFNKNSGHTKKTSSILGIIGSIIFIALLFIFPGFRKFVFYIFLFALNNRSNHGNNDHWNNGGGFGGFNGGGGSSSDSSDDDSFGGGESGGGGSSGDW